MSEAELYKELGILTKNREKWKESIPFVSSLISDGSVKIQAKALWLLGEMGLSHPDAIGSCIPTIAAFLESPEPLLRERAVNALGRIGRGGFQLIEPYWAGLFRFAADEEAAVRLNFIWASENIATNTPDIYEGHMPVFAELLHDEDEKVRMEAPEIFRVLGKCRPDLVKPYLDLLREVSETDGNRVVRIHCLGAIKAADPDKKKKAPLQTTNTVLMVRPVAFAFNGETAVNNAFQKAGDESGIQASARKESDDFIKLLKANGINVISVEDTPEPHTPDSVFPNNWFSTHDDGTLVLYPMFAENRRLERKPAVLEAIRENFDVRRTVDLTHYEQEGLFLEGTGSMVLDRVNRIAYACSSPRTSGKVLDEFCRRLGYAPLLFEAADANGMQIYHTNVMMHVGTEITVVCMDAVRDPDQKAKLRQSLESSGRMILEISFEQMEHFAGNMLELRSKAGEACLVLSRTAYASLAEEQRELLESRLKLITPELDCIERIGGGSARCMLAELF